MLYYKSRYILVILWLLLVIPVAGLSDEIRTDNPNIRLSKQEFKTRKLLDFSLSQPNAYKIQIKQNIDPNLGNREFFYLKPQSGATDKHGYVKVAIRTPYKGKGNQTVIRDKIVDADNSYSACPKTSKQNSNGLTQVCKPIIIQANGYNATPGIIYSNTFRIKVNPEDGKDVYKDIYVYYKKSGFPIDLHNYNPSLSFSKPGYKATARLCVSSPYTQAYNGFDTTVTGDYHDGAYQLSGQNGLDATFPYQVKVSQGNRAPESVSPWKWIEHGELIQVDKGQKCSSTGKFNLEVTAIADKNDVRRAAPGLYQGTLTVRVRAK